MNIIELIRRRVEAIRTSTTQTPIEIVNEIIQSPEEKDKLITMGPYLGIEINDYLLNQALITYRTELHRVVAMEDGIFRDRGIENGYTLSENEDTCWGTYYNKLIHDGRNPEDLRRVIDECNVLVQQFLPQPVQNADRRGLVIGQVQSGKTTIFNGVISAAADMGFNLIIILSGTLESLRTQTQKRIIKDVSRPWAAKNNTPFYFTWISDPENPGLVTAGQASHVLTDLSNQGRRQVAIGVFLKNASVLTNLKNFLNTINLSDRPNIRALIIDDEADQATPNAGVNRNTITAINRGIKSLIIPSPKNNCPTQGRTSYLGFTATPFGNLLNEAGEETLYPRDFLYFLRSSDRYFGPWQLFGNPDEVEGEETIIPLDVIRILSDEDISQTVPQSGRRPRPVYSPTVSPGLRKAICWYALAAAARRVTDPESWSTMLIHTSSKTSDHEALFRVVNTFCNNLQSDWSENRQEWQILWEEEIQRLGLTNFAGAFPRYGSPASAVYPEWNQVEEQMEQVIRDIRIKIDNSLYAGTERLQYSDEALSKDKLQIAIGGNTLSRGLTLEGLVSSYFARQFTAQSAYDTLLQMGRWFGFRQGYELLSRLWTTEPLKNAFRDLVIMELNLRKSMQLYLQGQSPANKAPVITRMPAMAITRKSVIGNTAVVEADYSGAAPQTISFVNERQWLQNNLISTETLLEQIEPYITNTQHPNKIIYNNVPVNFILEFIRTFNFWPRTNTFNKGHMLDFIDRNDNLYEHWSVVIMGGTITRTFGRGENTVRMINRSRIKGANEIPSRPPVDINLKSLRATRDLLCDRPDLFQEGLKETEIWNIRRDHQLNPILIIYPIDKESGYNPPPNTANTNYRTKLSAVEDIIGISLVMNPPTGQQGARGISLNLEDVYANDDEADTNPDLPDPLH